MTAKDTYKSNATVSTNNLNRNDVQWVVHEENCNISTDYRRAKCNCKKIILSGTNQTIPQWPIECLPKKSMITCEYCGRQFRKIETYERHVKPKRDNWRKALKKEYLNWFDHDTNTYTDMIKEAEQLVKWIEAILMYEITKN